MPPVPPRGRETVPQRREMFYRQMRRRASRLCAWPARPEERPAPIRLRQATTRETENPPHLRHPRAPVPRHLRGGSPPERHYRREPAAVARIALGHGVLPYGFRRLAQRGAA